MTKSIQITLTIIPDAEHEAIRTNAFIIWLKNQFHGCDLGEVKLNSLMRFTDGKERSVLLSADDYNISA